MKAQIPDILERTAQIIAARGNKTVTVTCRGNEAARCDAKGNIILPALPDPLPSDVLRAFHGVLDHENGHALFSDFSPIAGFTKKHGQKGFFILNVVEDLRIEAKMESEYLGSRENLAKAHADCLKKWEKNIQSVSPYSKVIGNLFAKGKGWDCSLYGKEANAVVDLVADLIKQAARLRNTKAAVDLTERILTRWKNALPPEPKPEDDGAEGDPQDAKDDDGRDGESQDGEGNGDDGAEKDSQGPGEAEPEGEAGDTSQQGGNDPQNGAQSDSKGPDGDCDGNGEVDPAPELDPGTAAALKEFLEGQAQADAPSLGEHLQKLIENACKANGGSKPYRVFSKEYDTVTIAENGDPAEFQKLLSEVKPLVSGLRQKLLAILKSKSQSRWIADDAGAKLDRRRLHRLMLDIPSAPFASKSEAINTSLALTLLIDCSGSMLGPRIELAKQCAALLSETLAQVNLPFEILGFSTDSSNPAFLKAMNGTRQKIRELERDFSRLVPLALTVFKSFRENYRSVRGRIANMEASEYTPLGESLIFAAKRMLGMKGVSRRILIVLTDGEPSVGNPCSQESVEAQLDRAIQQVGEAGIEVVGVGIAAPYVTTHFPKSILVNNLEELPKEFYGLLSKLLLRHVGTIAA